MKIKYNVGRAFQEKGLYSMNLTQNRTKGDGSGFNFQLVFFMGLDKYYVVYLMSTKL